MVFIFMGILLVNKMCTTDVKVYQEKKFGGENLEALQFPRLLLPQWVCSVTLKACRPKTRHQL